MLGFGFCCCDKGCDVLGSHNDTTPDQFAAHYNLTENVVPTWNDAGNEATFTEDCTFAVTVAPSRFCRDNVSLFVPVGGGEYYSRIQYAFDFEGTVIYYIWDFGKVDEYGRDDENGTFDCVRFRLIIGSETEFDTDLNPCDGVPDYDTAYIIRRDNYVNCYVGNQLIDRRRNPIPLSDDLGCAISFKITGTNYSLSSSTEAPAHGFSTLRKPDKFWLFPEFIPKADWPSESAWNEYVQTFDEQADFWKRYVLRTKPVRPANYNELSTSVQNKWDAVLAGENEREGCPYPASEWGYIEERTLPFSIPLKVRFSGFTDARKEAVDDNGKDLEIWNLATMNGTSQRLVRHSIPRLGPKYLKAATRASYETFIGRGALCRSTVSNFTRHIEATAAPGVEFGLPTETRSSETINHGYYFGNRSLNGYWVDYIPESEIVNELMDTDALEEVTLQITRENNNVVIRTNAYINYYGGNSKRIYWKATVPLTGERISWRDLIGVELTLDPDHEPEGGWIEAVAGSKITIEHDGTEDQEYGPDSVSVRLYQYGMAGINSYSIERSTIIERATWGDESTFVRRDLTFPANWLLNATRYWYLHDEISGYSIASGYQNYITRKTWVDIEVVLDRYYVDPEDADNWSGTPFYVCQTPTGYANLAVITQNGVTVPARALRTRRHGAELDYINCAENEIAINQAVSYTEAQLPGGAWLRNGHYSGESDPIENRPQSLPWYFGNAPESIPQNDHYKPPCTWFHGPGYQGTYTSNYVRMNYSPGDWYYNVEEYTNEDNNEDKREGGSGYKTVIKVLL